MQPASGIVENADQRSMYIGGRFVELNDSLVSVENPATEAVVAYVPDGNAAHADMAVAAAKDAFPRWSAQPAIERGKAVAALADAIEREVERLAVLVTAEQGKPISQAKGEVAAAVTFLRHAAEESRRISGDIVTSDNRSEEIQIRRHPYGVVVALTAWNYPLALAARKIGPALVAGNTVVLLGHEITPLSGLAIAELADKIGFPPGVLNVVTGKGPIVGERLVGHPDTALITMTGSTRAGREIFRNAAEQIKVVRLELGGKAPFIVMEDADIDAAVAAAIVARFTNCGQICTCNERMYLHRAIADQFLEKFIEASKALTIGDPMADHDIGPKVSKLEVAKVAGLVDRSVAQGAEVLLAGGPLTAGDYRRGHWMSPSVLEVSDNKNTIMQEEVFGPVVAATRIGDFDEAIDHANDTSFGLSAYLFTSRHQRLMEAPRRLKFGELYLNRSNGEAVQGFHTGWGLSGIGGEDGAYGFDGYLRKQTTYLNWA
ncbi:aldehyde dehydrogenase family protein [Ruegeria sp. 2205SS24-7]|uniref:aldehyde dehydrogenase family protein n=1 Tax=Ruegeria discodermiae TaxID=3064389 RepID=UPI002741F17C|nr:aldehyde dehydrogenase family protein [Ruegeria sp. 2205SS24-7]MDP5219837.1 aldehyde dehydrogenase family protein [Ruegeria sp. 2205SS24-7]